MQSATLACLSAHVVYCAVLLVLVTFSKLEFSWKQEDVTPRCLFLGVLTYTVKLCLHRC